MTILPKKKHSDSKKSDSNGNNENRGRIRTGSNWSNQAERSWSNDDFSTDDSYRSNTFESRDSNESSVNTKRRHRSPPHRHKYHERQNEETGYNSSDEYDSFAIEPPTEELELAFEKALKEKKGFTIKKMAQDGACLFRAVADQVYGDQDMHSIVRRHCMDYMTKNADYFCHYVTEDFSSYIVRKRNDHCHGNHVEMQALSEMYNRTIEVYQYSTEPINTFHGSNKCDYEPIRLSYHGNVHYNSVINPNKPSVGVGLGLSGYKPWVSTIVNDAKKKSEEWHIEQQMLEDKLRATDWEATNEAMEEAVARESYLEWLKDCEKRSRGTRTVPRSTPSATSSTSTSTESKRPNSPHHRERDRDRDTENAPPSKSPRHSPSSSPSSPRHESPLETKTPSNTGSKDPAKEKITVLNSSSTTECKPGCSSSVSNPPSPPGAAGGDSAALKKVYIQYDSAAEWEDQSVLAAVLAQSQQEYLDSFKKNTSSNPFPSEDFNSTKS